MKKYHAYGIGPLILIPLNRENLELTRSWRNEERVLQQLLNTNYVTAEQHQVWFNNYQQDEKTYVWLGHDENDHAISQVSVYDIEDGQAQLGRLIVASHALGKGVGVLSVLGAIELARTLKIKKLWLQVRSTNDAAIRIYRACGFKFKFPCDEVSIWKMERQL